MTEDELLEGITGALTIAGYRWQHSRRSDLAQVQGYPGLPDIVAVHEGRAHLFALELKSAKGQPTYDQAHWLRGFDAVRTIDARIVRPADYDSVLGAILNAPHAGIRCVVCGRAADRVLDANVRAGLCGEHDV